MSDTGVPERYKHLNAWVKRPDDPGKYKKILRKLMEHSTIHNKSCQKTTQLAGKG